MNFVIDPAHRGVSVVEHRSAESEGLRFDSLWGLGIFSLSHARDKTKRHISLFLYRTQKLTIFLISIYSSFVRQVYPSPFPPGL